MKIRVISEFKLFDSDKKFSHKFYVVFKKHFQKIIYNLILLIILK